jgi:hypothetical protein
MRLPRFRVLLTFIRLFRLYDNSAAASIWRGLVVWLGGRARIHP